MSSNHESDDDRTQAHTPLTKGSQISRYVVEERIGAGGMGEVFAASDSSLGRRVALKFLPSLYSSDSALRDRFKREAEATARLNHPNIVTIHEVGEHGGRPFFAMELVEGQSLKDYLQKSDLSLESILDLAIQVCDGLAAAHARQVTHRDIKPSNILIDSYGRPKILDFGLATIEGTEALTRTGSTLGTIQYMSPEQTQGSGVDHRSDLFSFGVVLYEMVTGRNPFARDNTVATGQAIVTSIPEPLTRYRNDVPELLQGVVSKLLEKDPQLRYQSAGDVVADLKRILRDVHSGTSFQTVTAMPVSTPGKKASRRLVLTIASALALILVIAAVYWLPRFLPAASDSEGWDISGSEWKNSIAVLPFRDFSPEGDQEFFCDGITDAIIGRLSGLSDLKVISMTSVMRFKSPDRDLKRIGSELEVAAILEGSVQREGDRIRIRAQLIRVEDDAHLWSNTYDKQVESIFDVQDDISHAIVSAMKIELLGSEEMSFARQSTENLEAYNHYSHGRFFWRKRTEADLRTAIESFEKAVELDSGYALAWSGLADAWTVLPGYSNVELDEVLPIAREAAARALDLDDNLAEAHASLGLILMFEDNNEEAEKEFLRAIELNPGYVWSHTWYATTLTDMGRDEDAIRELEVSLELDPLNTVSMMKVAQSKVRDFDFEAAADLYHRAIDIEPSPAIASNYANVLTRMGRLDEAIALLEQATRDYPQYTPTYRSLGQAYAELGQFDKIDSVLAVFSDQVDNPAGVALWRAGLYRDFGKYDSALVQYQAALSLSPDMSYVWQGLAEVYGNLGDRQRAIEAADQFVAANEENAAAYAFRGSIHMFHGELERALEDFAEALRKDQDYRQAKLLTALVHLFRGEYQQVLDVAAEFERSDDAETRSEAADLFIATEMFQGHMQAALDLLDGYLTADSLNLRLFEMRGKLLAKVFIHEEMGQLEEALTASRRITALTGLTSPQDRLAWKDYQAYILALMGRFDEAEEVAENLRADIEASGKALDISAYWQTKAAIAMAANNHSEALEQLLIARDSVFHKGSLNYIQMRYMLAGAYLGAGQAGDAAAELEDLLGVYTASRPVCLVWMMRARYLLGMAYEELGRVDEAKLQYRGLLNQLSTADEDLPVLIETRARLDRLQS